eukprot:TRINITY_DN421_c0_g1_i1.p1 TRINITY_DN421_c0_g1~~TRINITY_DN421_c0_g1_i1.p1  ORF type:complete len:112 (+),score=4.76 TRINITY_DN421_c0_g1_i1:53-388(+)
MVQKGLSFKKISLAYLGCFFLLSDESLFFQVVHQEIIVLGFFSKVMDGNAGASHNLSGFSLFVIFAKTAPLSEVFSTWDSEKRDTSGFAKGIDELGVIRFVAFVRKDAQLS